MSNFNLVPEKRRHTRSWEGGKTSDLFIYPSAARAELKNYRFRISIATIEKKNSRFSDFSGFERIHLVCDGRTSLSYLEENIDLESGDQIKFDGSKTFNCLLLSTNAIVINLIYKKDECFEFRSNVNLQANSISVYSNVKTQSFYIVHCLSGEAEVIGLSSETFKISPGDTVVIDGSQSEILDFKIRGNAIVQYVIYSPRQWPKV